MLYFFIINGRKDKDFVMEEVQRQINEVGVGLEYEIYRTTGIGDGTRFVRVWCDLHPNVECCFVACGGTGMVNEVASGMVGFKKKSLGILAYGATNDFIKYYPDHDFRSLRKLLAGTPRKIDIIRAGENYSINVINAGFEAVVAAHIYEMEEEGRSWKKMQRSILYALFTGFRNRIHVEADGVPMNRNRLFVCTLANCRWEGGEFLCAPYADNEDGLIELNLIRRMGIVTLLRFMPMYRRGEHLDKNPGKRLIKYRRVRKVRLTSKNLFNVCLDGEIYPGHTFDIEIIPKEINLILPSRVTMKKRFEPIIDKCGEIIDFLMSSPDIPKDEALQFKIRLSIEEAVENVVRYAYEGGMGWIEVGTDLDPEGVMLTIVLKDAGVPFNPLEKEDPDITLSVEDRKIGGLGIFLCKKLMDNIEYKYEDGCNVLIMSKKVLE